jgi:hypothetical protein
MFKISKNLNNKVEIVIYIDTIDDIYSDFDLRKIESRLLSNDFINEVRMQGVQAPDRSKIELKILSPKIIKTSELTPTVERITKRRIRYYFDDEFRKLRRERIKKLLRALIYILSGLTCFFIVKFLFHAETSIMAEKIMFELITFFSWFATWKGIETFGDLPHARDIKLNMRLAHASIQFRYIKDFHIITPV